MAFCNLAYAIDQNSSLTTITCDVLHITQYGHVCMYPSANVLLTCIFVVSEINHGDTVSTCMNLTVSG